MVLWFHAGVDASPLMTWGSIEGTPFRLDGGDTPITATPGPTFKMPEPKKRDQLGLALADKVNRKHRQKRRDALARATALIGRWGHDVVNGKKAKQFEIEYYS